MRSRTIAIAASAVVAALILAGCSLAGPMMGADDDNESSESSNAAAFNDADLAFTMTMIPHHEQAIEMADILLAKDGVDERVVALAEKIKQAQGPEIDTMASWLDMWHESDDMEGMHHGGMMSDDDMGALEAASGADASRLLLEQMIVHHQGAIDMAEDEIADGQNAEVIALANKIVADQTAEIAVMQELLSAL